MTNIFTNILILILLIYSIVISMYVLNQFHNEYNYKKEKDDFLISKEKELNNRESVIVEKEICFRELTKIKTILNTVTDILKSYNLTTSNEINQYNEKNETTKSKEPTQEI